MTADLVLGYRGGSGGFLLLHLLCLSDQYHVVWQDDHTFEQVFKKQWSIIDAAQWKDSETWPNNYATALSDTSKRKIVFYCNPSLHSFTDDPLVDIITAYHSIKDPSWPEIHRFQDYISLDRHIRDEFETEHGMLPLIDWCRRYYNAKRLWIYTDIHSQETLSKYKRAYNYWHKGPNDTIDPIKSSAWDSKNVDVDAIDCLASSDIIIYLQDLLKNINLLVDLGLIDQIRPCQADFVQHWLNLHADEILQELGLDT